MNSPAPMVERIAVFHAGLLLLFATWAFGGNVAWARTVLSIGGSLSFAVIIFSLRERRHESGSAFRRLSWLWPLVLFDFLVVISLFHPSFLETTVEGAAVFVPKPVSLLWPSAARPETAVRELWLFNALILPCFTLALVVRQRRLLRRLLVFAAGNALVLGIFGTMQKLLHAHGLFFGAVHSPNPNFFASFVYQNHWGAFVVLSVSLLSGLIFCETHRSGNRDFWHSPAFTATVGVLLLAATAPLSGSRACTLLVSCLLAGAFCHALVELARRRRAEGKSPHAAWAALIAAALIAVGGTLWLAQPVINARLADTREQFAVMRQHGNLGSRAVLYRDTWRMARARLAFGWGLGAYPTVFTLYNTQESPVDRLPVYYEDAHSDWLQSVAEVGLAGTLLRGLVLVLPFLAAWRQRHWPALSLYLLSGCAALLLYAWIEFPFGCPAVTFTFLLCFFVGIRLALLEETSKP